MINGKDVKNAGDFDELYEHFRIKVDPGQSAIRVDKFLMDKMENISRNKIQNAARENYLFVNEKPVKSNYKVQPHDEVVIAFPFKKRTPGFILPEDIPLDIVYEDEHIIIINKEAGMVVHPGIGNYSGTLVNAMVHYLSRQDLPLKYSNENDRPGIVHRIDKDTTGLMVVAKTELAMDQLAEQFYQHTIEREYIALVWGCPEEPSGTISGFIGRHPTARLQMAVVDDENLGKHAVTHYEVIEDLYYVSIVKCRLETGRTHQIRVHMKSIGHPLFNDWRYHGDRIWKGTIYSKYKQFVENCFQIIPRQALHARVLGFIHPATGKHVRFEQDLPEDFENVLEKWRGYVHSRKDRT